MQPIAKEDAIARRDAARVAMLAARAVYEAAEDVYSKASVEVSYIIGRERQSRLNHG